MKYIDIFVAGSKTVDKYRDILKVVAGELNVENKLKGKNIAVRMCDYRDLGDNQKDYNRFIISDANVLFVVVDGQLGVVTKEEMQLAAEKYGDNRQSQIKVFVKGKEDDDENVNKDIYNTIKDLLGDGKYGVDFMDKKDFKTKAKRYIKQYIDRANKKEKQESLMKKIFAAMITIVFLIGGFYLHSLMPKDPVLLLAGGGSANNMIEDEYDINLQSYAENSLYVNMPSGDSWTLIKEDLLHNDNDSLNFKPISLSASEATTKDFLPSGYTENDFQNKKGNVISVEIGDENLVVYMSESIAKENGYTDTITQSQLVEIITKHKKDNSYLLFTTEQNSGTYMEYKKVIGVDLDSVERNPYGSQTNLRAEIINLKKEDKANKVVLLGSKYYQAIIDKDLNMKGFVVVDDLTNEAVKKSIYLYFVAESNGGEDSSILNIPPQIVEFLRLIKKRAEENNMKLDALNLDKINSNNQVKKKLICKKLIIRLDDNDLVDW